MTKKILQDVKLHNLFSLSWVEEVISNNFTTIVQYLREEKARTDSKLLQLQKNVQEKANPGLSKEDVESVLAPHLSSLAMKIIHLQELTQQHSSTAQRVRSLEQELAKLKVHSHSELNQKVTALENETWSLGNKLNALQINQAQAQPLQQLNSISNEPAYNEDQVFKRLDQLSSQLLNYVPVDIFNQANFSTQDRLSQFEAKLTQQIRQSKNRDQKTRSYVKLMVGCKKNTQPDVKEAEDLVDSTTIKRLKSELQQLRTDLQQLKSRSRKEGVSRKQTNSPEKRGLLQELRKQLNVKIADLRSELKGAEFRSESIKDLGLESEMQRARLEELRLAVSKKAELADTRKQLQFIENKVNALLNIKEEGSEEARLARKSWYCLSCDKLVTNYRGRETRGCSNWDSLPPRKLVLNRKAEKADLPFMKN